MNFGNVLTAMVTPFNESNELDLEKTEQLVEYLIANGSDGLVVGGTTGEWPTLTEEEKLQLFEQVVKVVNGRAKVIAGTGTNSTESSIAITKEASKTGVDGIMLVTPYYNKPSQEGLYQHFKAIADATTLPIMLYNIPGRSVVDMSTETTIRLSKIDNIVCTKDATGDLDRMSEIIEQTDNDFSLYCGDDGLTLPSLAVGSAGVVSVAAHVIGNEMQRNGFGISARKCEGSRRSAPSIATENEGVLYGSFTGTSESSFKQERHKCRFSTAAVITVN